MLSCKFLLKNQFNDYKRKLPVTASQFKDLKKKNQTCYLQLRFLVTNSFSLLYMWRIKEKKKSCCRRGKIQKVGIGGHLIKWVISLFPTCCRTLQWQITTPEVHFFFFHFTRFTPNWYWLITYCTWQFHYSRNNYLFLLILGHIAVSDKVRCYIKAKHQSFKTIYLHKET